MLDEAAKHFGVDELTGLALLIIGWPFLPTRRKPKGATIGTSIASRVARRHLDFKIEKDILPTLTLGSVRRLKILWTRNIGVFVGRTVPIIGEVILAFRRVGNQLPQRRSLQPAREARGPPMSNSLLLEEVESFVRKERGLSKSKVLTTATTLEDDLGITGMEGGRH